LRAARYGRIIEIEWVIETISVRRRRGPATGGARSADERG
jgi:hypothetical protein